MFNDSEFQINYIIFSTVNTVVQHKNENLNEHISTQVINIFNDKPSRHIKLIFFCKNALHQFHTRNVGGLKTSVDLHLGLSR